jgi:autoinducer 2-degrading protein
MIATFVHVWVKTENIEDFKKASMANHNASVREPGNLRFDILQDADNPGKFVLYEAYESEEAAAAHKLTEHYQVWRDAVTDWMAQPREGKKHRILAH